MRRFPWPTGRLRGPYPRRSARPSYWPILALLGVLALGCDDAAAPPSTEDVPPAPEPDPAVLHVAYIALDPWLPPPDSADPPDAGWPDAGQSIEWVGHVLNSGEATAEDVPYEWTVDGVVVAGGTLDPPPWETEVALEWAWPAQREQVGLALGLEPTESDDGADHELVVAPDGLGVGFWVDTALVAYMAGHRDIPPFQAWIARAIRVWNDVLAAYPSPPVSAEAPSAVLDRLRLQQIEILPAGAPYPDSIPTDLRWVFWQRNPLSPRPGDPPEAFGPWIVVLHELIHGRGVHDLYSYRVFQGVNGSEVRIEESDGSLAVGGDRMPFVDGRSEEGMVFRSPYNAFLMGSHYTLPTWVNPLTAYGLNQVAGRRTARWVDELGNTITGFAVGYGENQYLLHVPDSARVHLEVDDAPAPEGVSVEIFFDHAAITYHNLYRAEPDWTGAVSADGTVTFPATYLQSKPDPDGVVDTDVIIFRVTRGDEWGYAFLPVYELNMEYVRGHRAVADVAVSVDVQ